MTRVWAFALMLASGANTACAARVPAAMGLVTEIPLPLDLRVLRRAVYFFLFFRKAKMSGDCGVDSRFG